MGFSFKPTVVTDDERSESLRLYKGSKKKPSEYGGLYVFEVILDDNTVLYKVGIVNDYNRIQSRFIEVLESFFTQYRYIPRSKICKYKKTKVPRLLEKYMHKILKEYQYQFDKKFGGFTEFFNGIDKDTLLEYLDNFKDSDLLSEYDALDIDDYNLLVKLSTKYKTITKSEENSDELPF